MTMPAMRVAMVVVGIVVVVLAIHEVQAKS
jgi:hypothetical protein